MQNFCFTCNNYNGVTDELSWLLYFSIALKFRLHFTWLVVNK